MKFSIASSILTQQLQAVSKVINSKNAIPIFENFLLRVEGDTLYIKGSDQENVLTACAPISDSDSDGAIAINARRLLETLREVNNQGLTFYVNENTLEVDIQFLNGHFNFVGADASLYPAAQEQEAEKITFELPSEVVLKGIENTLFAVSGDTIRPAMTGIYWDIHPEDITFVSSDTHKLVRCINRNVQPGMERSFIMPAKPAGILRSILGKESVPMTISLDSRSALFSWDTYSLECRFVKGVYPNYNRVIPSNNPFEMTIDRMSLLTAVKRVNIFASMASNLVKFNIQPDEVIVSGQDLDYATSAEERLTCSYQGNEMTIGFNGNYMVEVLSNLHSETIIIKLSDPSRPGLLLPQENEEGQEVLMLLMPMQVHEY